MIAVFQYFVAFFAPIHEFHERHQKYNEPFHPLPKIGLRSILESSDKWCGY